jgi:hypothetical protein
MSMRICAALTLVNGDVDLTATALRIGQTHVREVVLGDPASKRRSAGAELQAYQAARDGCEEPVVGNGEAAISVR